MPYFVTEENQHPDCTGYGVVKDDGELIGCHTTQQSAVDQMVAVSLAEGIEPGGTYSGQLRDSEIDPADTEARTDDRPACEECDGDCQVCESEERQVNLTPPAYMRAAARQGLKYYEEGKGGDGLVDRTIREARAMAEGNVTADKWVRIAAWIARHLVDLDAPAANPEHPDYPSAGVVGHLLWGSGPSKRAARRAMEYAQGVVSRIEEENEGRAKGEALSKIETRTNATEFEVREDGDGMTFTGYAALFDSPSEPLPFTERIAPGAFRGSLRLRNDIKFLWNHDAGEILGSTRAKTLKLYEDERGLRVEGTLPNTSRGRDVAELLRRGDVDSMSFGFSVPTGGDSWNSEGTERTLKKVRLHEVSLVAWPAYTATAGTVAVRGLDKVAERTGVDADALADALLKLEDGQTITSDEKEMLSRVIGDLAPEETVEEPKGDLSLLALKKKKLELLLKGI
jgi:HK97 family phage prohead protease